MLVDSHAVIGLSRGLDQKRNGTEPIPTNPTDPGTKIAENMMKNFSDSGHPIFRASSAFETRELKSKGGGKKSTHFNGSDEKRRVASPHGDFCESAQCLRSNSRSVQGTVRRFRASGNLKHLIIWNRRRATWKPGARIRAKNSNECPKTRNCPYYVLKRVWSCRNRTILLYSWYRKKKTTDATSVPRMHDASKWEEDLV